MNAALTTLHSPLPPSDRAWRLGSVAFWPIAKYGAPALIGLGNVPLCAFRYISGKPCPFCGGTHACAALFNGDWLGAWQANPAAVPLLMLISAHTLIWIAEGVRGQSFAAHTTIHRAMIWAWGSVLSFILVSWVWRLLNGAY